MNQRRRRGGLIAALIAPVVALIALAGCSSDDNGPAKVSTADAYAAAIRWYLQENPPAPPTSDEEPGAATVYIAPADGNGIDVNAQADVVAQLADMKDEVFVNFVDVRDDAIKDDDEMGSVKGDAVLLLVGPVEEAPPPVEVQIGVYRNIDDQQNYVMRIVKKGSEDFDVTAVTELEQN